MSDLGKFLRALLAGDTAVLAASLGRPGWRDALACGGLVAAGCGFYGAVVGGWRGELQAVATAIKFPLLVFFTCAGNALLNGCLSVLLGSGLGFRQTTLALLMSFAITAIVLAACAPVVLVFVANAPPLGTRDAVGGHSFVLLAHVLVIAWAGIAGNRCLGRLLAHTSGAAVARRVLIAWLAGNLLLGSQFAWVLRPFIGSPGLPVEFLRPDPLRGNFFEAVWRAGGHLVFPNKPKPTNQR